MSGWAKKTFIQAGSAMPPAPTNTLGIVRGIPSNFAPDKWGVNKTLSPTLPVECAPMAKDAILSHRASTMLIGLIGLTRHVDPCEHDPKQSAPRKKGIIPGSWGVTANLFIVFIYHSSQCRRSQLSAGILPAKLAQAARSILSPLPPPPTHYLFFVYILRIFIFIKYIRKCKFI